MLGICLAYTYCDVKCTYPSCSFLPKTADSRTLRNNGVSVLYDIYTVAEPSWGGYL